MAKKPVKSAVASTRLTPEEHADLEAQRSKTGLTPSKFYRELLLNSKPVFMEASVADERLLFIFNKSSNNLNQVAKRVHQAHQRGIISQDLYLKMQNNLVAIRDLLLAGVQRAD